MMPESTKYWPKIFLNPILRTLYRSARGFLVASQPLIDIAEAMSNEFSVFNIIVCSLVYVMLAHDNVKIIMTIYKSYY